jgi:hypothetical protein
VNAGSAARANVSAGFRFVGSSGGGEVAMAAQSQGSVQSVCTLTSIAT